MDAFFARSFADIRKACPPVEAGLERVAFNPLLTTPFIADERLLAPVPTFVSTRATASGLYYLALDHLSTKAERGAFFRDLGTLFETYVLDQARQLEDIGLAVTPEIEYLEGKRQMRTIDAIITFPDVTILVEAKTGRMTEAGRHGHAAAIEDRHREVLGDAILQLNRTFDAAERGLISVDLRGEVYGMVVTLEPYYFIEPGFLPDRDIPTTIATLEDYERLIAMALSGRPLADLLRSAVVSGRFWNLEAVVGHEDGERNPMLDAAYSAIAGFGGRLAAVTAEDSLHEGDDGV
jgi:hypothetical protein